MLANLQMFLLMDSGRICKAFASTFFDAKGNTDASGGESTEQADAKSGEEEGVVAVKR